MINVGTALWRLVYAFVEEEKYSEEEKAFGKVGK